MCVGMWSSKGEAQTRVKNLLNKSGEMDQHSKLWEQVLHYPKMENMIHVAGFVAHETVHKVQYSEIGSLYTWSLRAWNFTKWSQLELELVIELMFSIVRP